jgi:WASH complex subunit CCDC53
LQFETFDYNDFINNIRFALNSEEKLNAVDIELDKVETLIMLLEKKLESIPQEYFNSVPQPQTQQMPQQQQQQQQQPVQQTPTGQIQQGQAPVGQPTPNQPDSQVQQKPAEEPPKEEEKPPELDGEQT